MYRPARRTGCRSPADRGPAARSSGELVAAIAGGRSERLDLCAGALPASGRRGPEALARPTRTRPRPPVEAAYCAAQTSTSGRRRRRRRVERADDDSPIARRLGDEPPVVGPGDEIERVARERQVEDRRCPERVGVAAGQDERQVDRVAEALRRGAQRLGEPSAARRSSSPISTAAGSSISIIGQPAAASAAIVSWMASASD